LYRDVVGFDRSQLASPTPILETLGFERGFGIVTAEIGGCNFFGTVSSIGLFVPDDCDDSHADFSIFFR